MTAEEDVLAWYVWRQDGEGSTTLTALLARSYDGRADWRSFLALRRRALQNDGDDSTPRRRYALFGVWTGMGGVRSSLALRRPQRQTRFRQLSPPRAWRGSHSGLDNLAHEEPGSG